jgi:hypothetical protein
LLLTIDDFVEQFTGIFLGVLGGLLHRFGRLLKGLVCYVRRIAHIVIGHSTATVVTPRKLSFLLTVAGAAAGLSEFFCVSIACLALKGIQRA